MHRAWSIAVLLAVALMVPLLFEERLGGPARRGRGVSRDPAAPRAAAANPAAPLPPGAGPRAIFAPIAPHRGEAEGASMGGPPVRVEAEGAASPAGGRVRGTLRDPAGRPVRGARVSFGGSDAQLEAVTDVLGEYESPLLPPGPVPVFANHRDFQPRGGSVSIDLEGGAPRWDATLIPGERLAVRATGEDGQPVPDAEVWLLRAGGREPPDQADAGEWNFLGRTGDLGTLETRRQPGVARVRVRIAGYREETHLADSGDVHVALSPAPALRGHAVDAAGLPVRLTAVHLEVLGAGGFEESPDRGRLFRSLAPGRFVVGLPAHPGTYRLAARAAGALEGASEGVAFDGSADPAPVVFELEPRMEIRGSVRGPDGPLADAAVEVLVAPPAEHRLVFAHGIAVSAPARVAGATRADAGGRFFFAALEPGEYRVRASSPGFGARVSPPIAIPFAGECTLLLARAAVLTGTLFDPEGIPEAGTPIVLARGDDAARVAWTDGAGRFAFRDLPPWDGYALAPGDPRLPAAEPIEPDVLLAGGRALERPGARRLAIAEGKTTVHDLRRDPSALGSIEGTVLLDGAPAAGVMVMATAVDGFVPGPLPAAGEARAGADGRFRLRSLAPGKHRLACAELSVERAVEVAAGRRTIAELRASAFRYRLDLTDARTGQPYAGPAEVELTRTSPADGRRFAAAGTGSIEVTGVFPGRYRARVRAGGFLHHEEEVEIAQDRTGAALIEEGEDVTVKLFLEEGEPFSGAAEVVLSRAGREVYRRTEVLAGSVTVPTAGAADYEVLIRSADRTARVAFELRAVAPPPGPLVDEPPEPDNSFLDQ